MPVNPLTNRLSRSRFISLSEIPELDVSPPVNGTMLVYSSPALCISNGTAALPAKVDLCHNPQPV
ncbi:hypothetical protein OH76DRAFT_1400566 [Lentinus brumalis]|uniref:Uncharacterized protein n=1 Tax=Lentinus brumalis TaxID=2498619 RepID=A0A371DI72_9APHY|nr:hypothetical protein OH76DRAFT_1400566 [Polyporus brumalis]